MRPLLCFGDSNTWGFNAENRERYPYPLRWTSQLANHLGADFSLLVEGLNGRTTCFDDPIEGKIKNGLRYLEMVLQSHKPLAGVILMLGTNDLKARFNQRAFDIAQGMQKLVELCQQRQFGSGLGPEVLLVAPAPILDIEATREKLAGGVAKGQQLAHYYRQVAETTGCHFLDAGQHVSADPRDGVHLSIESHHTLARVLAEYLRREIWP